MYMAVVGAYTASNARGPAFVVTTSRTPVSWRLSGPLCDVGGDVAEFVVVEVR